MDYLAPNVKHMDTGPSGVGSQPLVTIMIPTYMQSAVLAKSIESALAQDYGNLEVIVADDASPDSTRQVVEAYLYDPRLRYHRNDSNLGRVGNYRHTLYDLARGEYVLNLDGDDWLIDPTYISQAAALLSAEPEVALVFANAWRYSERTNEYTIRAAQNFDLGRINEGNELFLKYANASVWIPHLTALYRRRIAIEIGFYNRNIIGADMDSLLRILIGRKIGFIDKTVAAWRFHAHNATKSLDVGQRVENLQCVEEPFRTAYASSEIDTRELVQWRTGMLTRLTNSFVRQCVAMKGYRPAARFYLRMLVTHPAVGVRVARDSLVRAQERLRGIHDSETLRYSDSSEGA